MKEWSMRTRNILAALCVAALSTSALADIGRVKLVKGTATIERAGQILPAVSGMILQKGDRLITGRDGQMGATFYDNTRFAAGPNSRVAIPEFAFDDTTHQGQFLTQVERGSLAVVSGQIAKSAKDAMRVRTPTALLGVRGTRFVVEVK
jgi:hypothetical protein